MVQKVRIARTDVSALQPSQHDNRPIWQFHPQLVSLIRRYLHPTSASIFAEPLLVPGAQFVEWYSDLSGQPVPYTSLSGKDKERVAKALDDRLSALRELAAKHSDNPLSAALASISALPPEEAVYVLNGQPVIVGWGRLSGGAAITRPASRAAIPAAAAVPPTPAAAVPPAAEAVPPASAAIPAAVPPLVAGAAVQQRGCLWPALIALLLLLLFLALAWWKFWPLPWLAAPVTDPPAATDTKDPLADLQAEEKALREKIAAAEKELADRLKACPVPEKPVQSLPPEQPAVVPPPKEQTPPAPPAPETPAPPKPQNATPPKPPAPTPAPAPKEAPKDTPKEPPKETPKAQDKPSQKQASCPAPRKKWEAPELVVLLDSSGSMGLKADISEELIKSLIVRAQQGDVGALNQLKAMQGGPENSRLGAAKKAVDYTLSTLPQDIDVGLVVFGTCEGADNYKFFSPAERGDLRARLSSITPQKGTPLARGIERAGNMVDGRSVPATLVVVSDGEDSCRGDPCAVARALKASKPKLTINVIDVNGLGEGRCIAEATGENSSR